MCVFVYVLIFRLIFAVIQEERLIAAEQCDNGTTIVAGLMVVIIRYNRTHVSIQVLYFIFVVNVVLELHFDHILIIITFSGVKCSKSILFQLNIFFKSWLDFLLSFKLLKTVYMLNKIAVFKQTVSVFRPYLKTVGCV